MAVRKVTGKRIRLVGIALDKVYAQKVETMFGARTLKWVKERVVAARKGNKDPVMVLHGIFGGKIPAAVGRKMKRAPYLKALLRGRR